MWIKLISPKVTMRPMDSYFKRHMAPPLSLLVLGALTPPEHKVTVEDENVERLHLRDRPDLVGLTVKADTADRSFEISRHYRRRKIPVILGGIHPTACPEACAPHADALVIGEGEGLWQRVVADASAGCLKRIYRQDCAVDQADSPVPRWGLIRGKNYLYTATLCAGRGCPWRCEFCYNSSPNVIRGHRMKPDRNILAEIASTGSRHIMFIDDNFIGSPERARAFLQNCMPAGLTWHTAVSADIGRHDDILDLMAETGCKSLFIGFESLNPANLASAHKHQNRVEEFSRTIRKIHDRGMMVNASLVFGFDHDGPDVFGQTQAWLIENRIETMTAHILTPYPGTKLHRRLLDENRIFDFDLAHYNTSSVVFHPRLMSADELRSGYLQLYSGFYSYRSIFRRIPIDPAQKVPFILFNLFYRKYGKWTSLAGRWGRMSWIRRLSGGLSYSRRSVERGPADYMEQTVS